MNRNQVVLVLIVCLISGLAGAVLATRLTSVRPVLAQSPTVLTANELRIVDARGNIRGAFAAFDTGSWLTLSALDGGQSHYRMMFNVNDNMDPEAYFYAKGRITNEYPGGTWRRPALNFVDSANRILANVPWTSAGGPGMVPTPQAASAEGGRQTQSVHSDVDELSRQIDALRFRVATLERRLSP